MIFSLKEMEQGKKQMIAMEEKNGVAKFQRGRACHPIKVPHAGREAEI